MFRRLRCGLPKEPVFAQDLKGLGYFINEKDEIRAILNPKAYFNFFITKNERYNALQREGMNESIRTIVAKRLEDLGLSKLRLPLGATETDKHLNIFISDGLKEKKEILVLFYEASQDLGIFAHRVIGGKGGINAGSAVNFVKNIQESAAKAGKEAPGIIIANLGHQCWSTRTKKAMTWTSWFALPRKSAADPAYFFDDYKNVIPGNKNAAEHVAYVFNNVLGNPDFCDHESKISVLGVSEGAVNATWFLHDPDNFSRWCKGIEPAKVFDWSSSPAEKLDGAFAKETYTNGDTVKKPNPQVICLAAVATTVTLAVDPENSIPEFYEITNPEFKAWFAQKGRAYSLTTEPAGTFLAPPEGHKFHQALGAPAFSLGEATYTERMLVVGQDIILEWFAEVAANPNFANEQLFRLDYGDEAEEEVYGEGAVWRAEDLKRYPNLYQQLDAPVDGKTSAEALPLALLDLSYSLSDKEKATRARLSDALYMLNDGKNHKTTSWSHVTEVAGGNENPMMDIDEDHEAGMNLESLVHKTAGKENDDEEDLKAGTPT